jgi:hypothetical protein
MHSLRIRTSIGPCENNDEPSVWEIWGSQSIKFQSFWDVLSCQLVNRSPVFWKSTILHLQSHAVCEERLLHDLIFQPSVHIKWGKFLDYLWIC